MRTFTLILSLTTFATIGCNSPEEATTTPDPTPTTEVAFNADGNPTVEFNTEGLHCENCAASACESLAAVPGVVDVKADHETNKITVAVDEKTFQNDTALTALHENDLFGDAELVE